MARGSLPRVILHLDMDAFYAAVEVRENPAFAGRPLIVGHRGRRGVVSTCSYEARRFGVRSAMPSVIAERLCPDAVWLPGRMELYSQVSRQIRRILDEISPAVEPISIDEAFLDLTGIASDLEHGRRIGSRLKERIRAEQRLTGSVGIAPNKFLAKLASDLEKPDGLVVFAVEDVPSRLWPLPVERLWGVGPKTAARLRGSGLSTVGDLLKVGEPELAAVVGDHLAAHLRALARGEDGRPVETSREPRSVGEERTYTEDLTEPEQIERAILERSEGVARELRREGLVARTVHLKVRTGDFTTWTRATTLQAPTDLADPIALAARRLFRERIRLGGRGVRLLGVRVTGLEPPATAGAPLLADAEADRARRLARATDAVRNRLGEGTLVRARLLPPRRGLKGGTRVPEASRPPSAD